MFRIKKVGILNLAYTVTIIYFILGIILGIVLAILKTGPNPGLAGSIGQDLSKLTYAQIIFIYPIAYAMGGFVISVIIGFLYNSISKMTGGISVFLVKDSGSEKPKLTPSKKK